MKVTIPQGYSLLQRGQPITVYDLEWNKEDNCWKFVSNFGTDSCGNKIKSRKKYTIRRLSTTERIQQLDFLLKHFPNTLGIDRYSDFKFNKGALIALILYLAGAKSIEFSSELRDTEDLFYKNDITRIRLYPSSIVVKPYLNHLISVNIFGDSKNLLWYLLSKLNVRYNGSASSDDKDSYLQASINYKNEKETRLFTDIVCYFNSIKKHFPN